MTFLMVTGSVVFVYFIWRIRKTYQDHLRDSKTYLELMKILHEKLLKYDESLQSLRLEEDYTNLNVEKYFETMGSLTNEQFRLVLNAQSINKVMKTLEDHNWLKKMTKSRKNETLRNEIYDNMYEIWNSNKNFCISALKKANKGHDLKIHCFIH